MVNLREDCEDSRITGKILPSSVKLNGSCTAEAGIKNGNSHHVLKISAVNGKVAVKESPLVNGNCSKAPVNGVKKPAVNGVPTVNENCEKAPVKEVSAVNGDSNNKVSVNDIQTVNGKCEAQTVEISSSKPKWCDIVAEEASLVNGNLNDKDSGICSNGSDTPSESGSCSYSHISDSVYNDEISDEDQNGFTEVVGKRSRRKNKPKNHRKKNPSNLPPGLGAENIRRDNLKDKNCSEKTQSPTPVLQKLLQNEKLPTRIFPAIRTAAKSYSSALLNGQNGNSQLKNGGSCVSSSTQNASNSNNHQNHNSSNKSVKNCDSSATNISVSQSSSVTAKTAINTTPTVSCSKPSNSSTKVEMTDVSAQTDICAEKELPTNECLPPTEVNDEPASSCTPNDVVVNDTVEDINDVPSNAACGESVEVESAAEECDINIENNILPEVEGAVGGSDINIENYDSNLLEVEGAVGGSDINIENYDSNLLERGYVVDFENYKTNLSEYAAAGCAGYVDSLCNFEGYVAAGCAGYVATADNLQGYAAAGCAGYVATVDNLEGYSAAGCAGYVASSDNLEGYAVAGCAGYVASSDNLEAYASAGCTGYVAIADNFVGTGGNNCDNEIKDAKYAGPESESWITRHGYNSRGRPLYLFYKGEYVFLHRFVWNKTPEYCVRILPADRESDGEVAIYDRFNPHCCEFPKSKVSLLIGKGGSFKKRIERETGIEIWVVDNPSRPDQSIIQMTGPADRIQDAKEIINNKFHMQLKQWMGVEDNIPLSEHYFATLPEHTEFYSIVSSIVNPNLFWVQQLGNSQYFALEGLEQRMAQHFHHNTEVPVVNNPSVGNVVAVPMTAERWVRGEIVEIISEEEVCVTFLDHGGVFRVPTGNLRPMRNEFLCIPFTACRCSLDGVLPTEWSLDALAEFARLCQRPPVIRVMHKTPDGIYYVQMVGFDEEAQQFVNITTTLLAKGFAIAYKGPQAVEFVVEPQQ